MKSLAQQTAESIASGKPFRETLSSLCALLAEALAPCEIALRLGDEVSCRLVYGVHPACAPVQTIQERLSFGDGVLGSVSVSRGIDPPFSEHDCEQLRTWAAIVAIRAHQAATEAANEHLEHLAGSDMLTGLANRRAFDAQLQREWQRACAAREPLAVVMVDVDYFKAYNDRYGHIGGDRALHLVAQALRSCLKRSGEMLARFGGEEFVALLPRTGEHEAIGIAERMREAVGALQIEHGGSQLRRVTVSAGIGAEIAAGDATATALLARADKALYEAKEYGRNRVVGSHYQSHTPVVLRRSTGMHNAPAWRGAFIGRSAEIAQVRTALQRSRLVAVTGSAGIGKTRLIAQSACREVPEYTDGVWYVDLGTCTTFEGALRAALAALGAEEDAGSPEQTIVAVLRSQSALLVLDACDHLTAALERFVDLVLTQTRNVRLLLARREPAGVPGEAVVRIGSLTRDDATALYTDRIGDRTREEEAEGLCERVGRVPLAIELLAAGAPAQACKSVDAMVRRSVASLPPDLRSGLEGLTIFPADFSAQAAAEVAECGDACLEQLERRSLIVAGRDGDAVRYRMLDVVHHAVRQEIESSREERLRARHFEYYRNLAANESPAALHAERENLTAALQYAQSLGTPEPLLALAAAAAPYWFRRGHLSEGLTWLTAALDRAGEAQTPLVAQSLRYAGMLARRRSDQAAARYFNEKALHMWENLGNDAGVASALNGLALIAHTSGEFETAQSLYDRSRRLNDKMGDSLGVAMATNNMGGLAMFAGRYSQAEALLREALALGERLDDRAFCALASNNLAEVLFLQQRFTEAQALVERGIAIREALGDRPGLAASRLLQGHVYVSQGRFGQAWQALRESLLSFRDVGNRSGVASSLLAAARLLQASGRSHEALRMVGNADATFRRLGAAPLGLDKVVRDAFSSGVTGEGAGSFEDAFEEAVAAFR